MDPSKKSAEERLLRFTLRERTLHWTVALSFLYCALSGLSLWTPLLFWLAAVLGGGEAVRWGHPWGGVIFFVALSAIFREWARDMKLDADDWLWLRNVHKYARHEESGLPEPGRFNAGQKTLFWLHSAAAVLLLSSGIVLWLPEVMPRALRLAAILIHPAVAAAFIAGIMLHIYMATVATPGAFRGMIEGWVPPRWAASHHPKWYREASKN